MNSVTEAHYKNVSENLIYHHSVLLAIYISDSITFKWIPVCVAIRSCNYPMLPKMEIVQSKKLTAVIMLNEVPSYRER